MQAEVIHALGNPGGNGIDQGLQAAPIGALAYYSQLVHLKSLNGHYRCHVDITSGGRRHQEESQRAGLLNGRAINRNSWTSEADNLPE